MSTLKSNSIQPTTTGNNLIFRTGAGDVERMRIDTSGNVGIGTNSPDSKLHVVGSQIKFDTGTTAGLRLYEDADTASFLRFRPLNTSQRGFVFSNDGDAPHLTVSWDAASSTTTRVGIGTASPAVELDVVGQARTSVGTTAGSNAKTLVTKDYTDKGLAFAWVVFADPATTNPGTTDTTCTILSGKNVSSVVRKLGGVSNNFAYYELTFTEPCVDVNYCATGSFVRRRFAANSTSDSGWPQYLWPLPPYDPTNYGHLFYDNAPEDPIPAAGISAVATALVRPSTKKVFRFHVHLAHARDISPIIDVCRMGMVKIFR
jgi:hypothetical protein